jgi:hypothetical protein
MEKINTLPFVIYILATVFSGNPLLLIIIRLLRDTSPKEPFILELAYFMFSTFFIRK